MALHDELAAVSAKLDAAVASALENEVADSVKREMADTIEAEAYIGTSPFFNSTRRMDEGGLTDGRNFVSWVEDYNTLYLQNDTPAQSLWEDTTRMLDVIVENGALMYPKPVDFYGDTEKSVVSSGAAEIALQAGLKRQGY